SGSDLTKGKPAESPSRVPDNPAIDEMSQPQPSLEEVALADEQRHQTVDELRGKIANLPDTTDFPKRSTEISAEITRAKETIGEETANQLYQENLASYRAWAARQTKPAAKGGKK